eukprot:TRINITY_DN12282_c0_g1_i1.p1 TRINITY_DN12282_c0_g1~~TRINITY_DN12282_c0_g1_i1.p1  ORF type:complete len:358 (+),score=67.32 TRINITY_DN12282_c0_g1_i1:69-1076(+)
MSLKRSMFAQIPATRLQVTHLLYHCASMDQIASAVSQAVSELDYLRRGEVKWEAFEDGFPNIMLPDVNALHNRHCVVLADFLDRSEIFEQLSLIYSLPGYWAKSLTVVLPYFPTGTMERVDHEGQIATAKTMCRMLSAIPLTASGPTRIVIFDIHALQNRFYFGDNVIPILLSGVPIIKAQLKNEHGDEPITIAFPDEGAQKRFGKKFDEYDHVVCIKKRVGATGRKVTIKEGVCVGRHVVIIDDLVKTGGTLLQCKTALFEAGATKVSCYVTHAVFPQKSYERFVGEEEGKGFAKFYVTDSCPTVAKVIDGKGPFQVLPIAPAVAAAINAHKHQ